MNKINHYMSSGVFFPCEVLASDGIKCEHENGLKLSITFLILYAYIKKSQMFAI